MFFEYEDSKHKLDVRNKKTILTPHQIYQIKTIRNNPTLCVRN